MDDDYELASREISQNETRNIARKLMSAMGCKRQMHESHKPRFAITSTPIDGTVSMVSHGGDDLLVFFSNASKIYVAKANANNTIPITIRQIGFLPSPSSNLQYPHAACSKNRTGDRFHHGSLIMQQTLHSLLALLL